MIGTKPEGRQVITTGTATTILNGVGLVLINPASVLATHTVTMPANPADRDEVHIFFGGTITSGVAVVTALTIAANTGQALVGSGLVSANSGHSMTYFYDAPLAKWYRVI